MEILLEMTPLDEMTLLRESSFRSSLYEFGLSVPEIANGPYKLMGEMASYTAMCHP